MFVSRLLLPVFLIVGFVQGQILHDDDMAAHEFAAAVADGDPPYFDFYYNHIGHDYLRRCIKRDDPPANGVACTLRHPKACLWGTQTCPTGTPGGQVHPLTRCDCQDGEWRCKDFKCPTIEPVCPLTNPTGLQPICSGDMHCGYGREIKRCGRKIHKTRCTGQAGQRLECFETDRRSMGCETVEDFPIITVAPSIAPSTAPSIAPSAAPGPFQCSTTDESIDIRSDGLFEIENTVPGQLCTLSLVSSDGAFIKPVGRSYTGFDWEASAGEFKRLDFNCTNDVCVVTLPPLQEDGAYYQATTFSAAPRSNADVIARFLEQTTFGPTRSDISSFSGDTSNLAMAKWIRKQQNEQKVPMTSHRKLFRERLNARMEVASPQGRVTHPCQVGTRYRRFAFSSKDSDKYIDVETVGNKRILSVNGFVRTIIDGPIHRHRDPNTNFDNGRFRNLRTNDPNRIGAAVLWSHPGKKSNPVQFGDKVGNPPIQFDTETVPNILIEIADGEAAPVDTQYFPLDSSVEEIIVTGRLGDAQCDSLGETGNPDNPVFALYKGEYFIHDPRFDTLDNTLEEPDPDGGGKIVRLTANVVTPELSGKCSNAPRTFLSEADCVLSYEPTACTIGQDRSDKIPPFYLQVTPKNVRGLFKATGNGEPGTRFVYAVDGLRIADDHTAKPPCVVGSTSRWEKVACTGNAEAFNSTLGLIFGVLLSSSTDENPLLRDVVNQNACDAISDAEKKGFEIEDEGGNCWLNVHPEHMNVYDFTYWTLNHPGNGVLPHNPKPIERFAEANRLKKQTTLIFPEGHEMVRWPQYRNMFGSVGRLYDTIRFDELPLELRTASTSEHFGFVPSSIPYENSNGTIVCGSPFEVSNNQSLGGSQLRGAFDSYNLELLETTSKFDFIRQKKTVWTLAALSSDDQLRQRVAWALAQLLVIHPSPTIGNRPLSEDFLTYYDIFVRHAFGNYRDILKEVSYSVMMAEMLSYKDSWSTAITWEKKGIVAFADENYAREIMQLFTIGYDKLNPDGSELVDIHGDALQTYTNDDIMEYARVWTGFTQQPKRGNIEFLKGNRIDPMTINMNIRDSLPKMGLDRKYVGDGFPLCADLPKKHFLKRGATYRLLGRSKSPELQIPDPNQWKDEPNYVHLTAQPIGRANTLFAKLCGSRDATDCKFASKVVLERDLSCMHNGTECTVDTIRTIEVSDGIFYEYERKPCVHQAFYNDAVAVVRRENSYDLTCADPRVEAASVACCDGSPRGRGEWNDTYWGERTTFATAQQRCSTGGICSPQKRPLCTGSYCSKNSHYWTTSTNCTLRAKIDKAGKVAIVHDPVGVFTTKRTHHLVRQSTKTFFRVDWSGNFTQIMEDCGSLGACEATADDACVCDITVSNEQIYFDGATPSRDDVLGSLHIGAFDPATDESGSNNDVTWYNEEGGGLTSESVFEVVDTAGRLHRRKNMRSTAQIMGSNVSFRNPVHFIDLVEAELRDAHHETDAALDHYLYHPNTAPFLAIRFAKRFGISNPSPRYIKRISNAFRTGQFSVASGGSSVLYGSGQYGDLAATIACVLLDREAREVLLDSDPSQGSLREPLIKLVGLLRSLELKLNPDEPFVDLDADLGAKTGQMAHEIPDVFSFFRPEHQPAGPIAQATLTAPEGQVLTGPRIIDTLNGYMSLIKYGLSSCFGGISEFKGYAKEPCRRYESGKFNKGSRGALTYAPSSSTSAAAITDELATLLTGGRLPAESREAINRILQNETEPLARVIKAEQLITFTPEFHSTGISKKNGEKRTFPEPTPPLSLKKYKAVVYLQLEGAFDSFNMLAPHTCEQENSQNQTLFEQYMAERTSLAIGDEERSLIINTTDEQPCSQFVVHEDLRIVHKLYNDGDLSFFANTGVLTEPVTKENYAVRTKTQLFAHNRMRREAQRLDPLENSTGTGILGRMCDKLYTNGFHVQPTTIRDTSVATIGEHGVGEEPLIVSPKSISKFNPKPSGETFDPTLFLEELNEATELQSSLFGEVWSKSLRKGLKDNKTLLKALEMAQLNTTFPSGALSDSFKTISSLVASRNVRGKDRDVFFAASPGWDHHSSMKARLSEKFIDLNAVLTAFVDEMKAQGVWNQTALVITSDFGRTLTANSGEGSDHAWGGNYFVMGGSVDGGKIHGAYPADITRSSPLNIGRGRLIPTLSWESMMNSVVNWMGVPDSDLDYCMPNRNNTGTKLFQATEVFN